MKRGLRAIVVAAVASAALLAAGPAWSSCGHTTKKGNPAIAQYVEQIPTSCGSQPASQSGASGSSGGAPLPASTARRISNGPDKSVLRRVATTRPARVRLRGADFPRGADRLLNVTGQNSLGAAVGGVATNGSMLALVIVMAALAALAIGGALYRRRMPR